MESMSQSLQALNALNFFIADVRDGLGPFLGVFLQGKDGSPGQIGILMTLVLVPVQILDGVGAGLLGVAVPGLAARILDGTGHVNAGLAAVMTLQAVGAACSTTLAGFAAERFGYWAAFFALGCAAVAALLIWLLATPIISKACSKPALPQAA